MVACPAENSARMGSVNAAHILVIAFHTGENADAMVNTNTKIITLHMMQGSIVEMHGMQQQMTRTAMLDISPHESS